MIRGLLTAVTVTAVWITIQILWMHIKPAANRFNAMLLGYVLSLPLVYVAFQWFPGLAATPLHEPWGIGLFLAYVLHLLLYLFYMECFYYVERSVNLRFLVEILQRSPPGARLDQIMADYNVESMVRARLADLEENNFIERRKGQWFLKPKGTWVAAVLRINAWIYQSVR